MKKTNRVLSLAIELAIDRDRAFFRKHPDQWYYTRKPVLGECESMHKQPDEVREILVGEIDDGFRIRYAISTDEEKAEMLTRIQQSRERAKLSRQRERVQQAVLSIENAIAKN